MSILDPRLWLALVLVIAAAFGAGYWRGDKAGQAKVQGLWAAEKATQLAQARERDAENRQIEQRRQSMVMEANNAARKRETVLRGAASAARTELDGLRDDLARAPGRDLPGSTCEAHGKRISTLETVLSQCAGRYSGMAEIADRALNDSLMLQEAWPR
jgi:Protein of unknown function (DUF2514)